MAHNNPTDFEFGTWRQLAKTSPESFATKRLEAIEQLIASAPLEKQQRLRGLQWQIDQTRERANNPLTACVRVSALMWNAVAGENGLIENLASLAHVASGRETSARPPGAVLSFKRQEKHLED